MALQFTQEDYALWLAGERPITDALHSYWQVSTLGNKDFVCQPLLQKVSSSGATGVELYRNPENHADAVGAILNYSATMANFSPSKGLDNQADAFNGFLEKIQFFPGFASIPFPPAPTDEEGNETRPQTQTSTNIDNIITDIDAAYNEVVNVDKTVLTDSLNRLANSIINHSSKSVDQSILTQVAIIQNDEDLIVTVFYATISMAFDDQANKKTYVPDAAYNMNKLAFKTTRSDLVQFAELLADKVGNGSCDQFAKNFSSPGGDQVSCFEAHAAAKEQ